MKFNPLLPLLLLLIAAIAVGDYFFPFAFVGGEPQWPAVSRTWTGVVTQMPRTTDGAAHVVVRLEGSNRRVALTTALDTTPSLSLSPSFAPGDLVAFNARIEKPRNAGNPGEMDYATYLRHQGVTGQAFCRVGQWSDLGRASSLQLHERMLCLRSSLVESLSAHFDGDALAIVSAMTLGDRSGVDRSLRELYNRSGASHLLALSGLHLSILFTLFALLLQSLRNRWGRVGERVGQTALLVVLWTFVLLAGLPLSLVRAATMFTIATLLHFVSHSASSLHMLLLTLIIMLLWSPAMLFDIGLQLSAIAVAAIVGALRLFGKGGAAGTAGHGLGLMQRNLEVLHIKLIPLRRRIENFHPLLGRMLNMDDVEQLIDAKPQKMTVAVRMVRAVAVLFVVSAAAQLATMPLVAHYFGRVSIVGLLTAFVAIPTAYVIMFGVVAFFVLVPLRPAIAVLLTSVIGGLHLLMAGVAAWPLAAVEFRLSALGVVVVYILMMWMCHQFFVQRYSATVLDGTRRWWGRAFRTTAVAALVLLLTMGGERLLVLMERPSAQVAIYNRSRQREIHLVTPTTDSILTPSSPHLAGRVLMYAGQRVAIIDSPMPYVADVELPPPLPVDVVLISRGAKGHLADILLRYAPDLIALDGCLSAYYRERFSAEAALANIPVYDIRDEGALLLNAEENEKK